MFFNLLNECNEIQFCRVVPRQEKALQKNDKTRRAEALIEILNEKDFKEPTEVGLRSCQLRRLNLHLLCGLFHFASTRFQSRDLRLATYNLQSPIELDSQCGYACSFAPALAIRDLHVRLFESLAWIFWLLKPLLL